jgi:translation initiation factor 2-alpha kinase 4
VSSFLEGPIVAIETKDEYFDGLRNTRLSDAESWRKLIQNTAADDRAYLRDVHKLLQDISQESSTRNAFLYNFRSKACIYYDLGRAL